MYTYTCTYILNKPLIKVYIYGYKIKKYVNYDKGIHKWL